MHSEILKKPLYVSLLLFCITIGVYYPSVMLIWSHPEALIVEDSNILAVLANGSLSLDSILRFYSSGKYLRPVTDFSYLMDFMIWGGDPFGFRMTNLLIHAINVVLCYRLFRFLLKSSETTNKVAFFSALLFALHPVAVESISWISGRTDPLALFFSLLALIFYFISKENNRWYLIFFSFLSVSLSLLSKETGLATFIIIVAFEIHYCPHFGYRRWSYSLPFFFFLLFAITAIFTVRAYVLPGNDVSLKLISRSISDLGLFNVMKYFFASYGFYFKKIIYPYPLNFAIDKINITLYAICGLVLVLSLLVLIKNSVLKKLHFYFLWAFTALSPAALISFTDIAWTHWAERYIYFSLVPMSLTFTTGIFSIAGQYKKKYNKKTDFIIILICFLFFFSTLDRSILFSSNEKILYDSYKKSPYFLTINLAYAQSLIKNNKTDKAKGILLNAEHLPGFKHQLYFTSAQIFSREGDYQKAEKYYYKALQSAKNDKRLVTMGRTLRKDIYVALAELEIEKIGITDDRERINNHYRKAAFLLEKAYKEAPYAFLLYRLAKIYLKLEDNKNAKKYLRKFIHRRAKGDYVDIARKMLTKIEEKTSHQK